MNFEEFLKEIKKKKSIKPNQIQEYSEVFNESLVKIGNLQRQIKETDRKINQLVYELYDLTDEEIRINENTLKE